MMLKYFIAVVLAAAAMPAFAHEGKGPNGGRVVEASPYHIELVTEDQLLAVYVTDSDEKPVVVTGFKGTAILVVDGKSQRIPLSADQASRLTGTPAGKLPAEPKGVVQITAPGGKSVQGRFN
jgi:hypothetical protein